jgi:hypothetical protein
VLGVVGFFLPILWLFGAILPARRGSRYAIQQAIQQGMEMQTEAEKQSS